MFFIILAIQTLIASSGHSSCSVRENIVTIHSITSAIEALDAADDETLVAFDVGEMIYILQNNLYRMIRNPYIFDREDVLYVEELLAAIKTQNPHWKEEIKSNIMLTCPPKLVEDEIVDVIKKLQFNSVKTIALCSANPGPYGLLTSTRDWRFSLLQKLGIDFSSSFDREQIIFDQLDLYHGDYPEYYKGIIFGSCHLPTGHNPKGRTLSSFFDAINWEPKRVIAFDDCEEYLVEIGTELRKRNISFQGYLYRVTSQSPQKINREIIELQIECIKRGVFLSDEEAEEKVQFMILDKQ